MAWHTVQLLLLVLPKLEHEVLCYPREFNIHNPDDSANLTLYYPLLMDSSAITNGVAMICKRDNIGSSMW